MTAQDLRDHGNLGPSFTSPAIDTITGIAPASVPGFVASELVGFVIGLGLGNVLYPQNFGPQWIES